LNTHCPLTNDEETNIIEMNHIIMNGLNININSSQNSFQQPQDQIIISNNDSSNNIESESINKFSKTLEDVEHTSKFLLKVKDEIDSSFDKLKNILESRNTLSTILKDFNNTTKTIMNEKNKISKLNSSIEKIYKMYEDTKSIEAFFENSKEDCVEKIRFTSDYEEIENGISFFTLNSSYVEAENYLNTYNMLKRIAITRYYNYMSQSLQSFFNLFEGININDEFFNFILNFSPKNVNKKFYNFPKNFEKIKNIQIFFEAKAKYDYDVKKSVEAIKQKFIDNRVNLLKTFYEEIFGEINKAFFNKSNDKENNSSPHKKFSEIVYSAIAEISKMTILEIIFFITIFQTKASDNTYILQKLTSDIYSTFYNYLRPIIVNSDNLDQLFILFDGFDHNFGIFFLDILEGENSKNKEEIKNRVISFFSHLKDLNNEDKIKTDLTILNSQTAYEKIISILKVSKILIRPTILKLVQDVQEKIYFKINMHVRSNFIDLESDIPSLSIHEERVALNYPHFKLFHFFLRRLSIVLELLKNKLDKGVVNELTVFCIEKFITILNEEILNNKTLTFEFEVYIIQQILLGIKIMEDFEVEAVQTGVDIDFYSITDIFSSNLQNLFSNLNIKDILVNSAPKLYDKTRDFKKILLNNLLKAYKILINLVNENIFGRDIMDVVYKIRNKETIDEKLMDLRVKDKKEFLCEMYTRFEKIISELKSQIRLIDVTISNKLSGMIIENITNITNMLHKEVSKFKSQEYEEISAILDWEVVSQNLNNIKISIFQDI
jgi:hypothetical protein